jgi:hypothetical protein
MTLDQWEIIGPAAPSNFGWLKRLWFRFLTKRLPTYAPYLARDRDGNTGMLIWKDAGNLAWTAARIKWRERT